MTKKYFLKNVWQKANSSLLILSCLTTFFTTSQAQNPQSQSDRIKLERNDDGAKSSDRLVLGKGSINSSTGSSGRLDSFSQRLNLVRSSSMEYNQQLRIQQVGEVFVQSVKLDNKSVAPKAVETPIAKAERLLKQGNLAQAKEIYNKLVAENNKDYRARSGAAYILLQEGEIDSALKEYEEIIKSYNDSETKVNYGVALYRSGKVSQAAEQYEEVLKNNKTSLPTVHFNLAMSYAHLGESEKAVEHYQSALKQKNNKYPEAANNLGLVYEALFNNEEANKYFKVAAEIKSSNSHIARYNLARQYLRIGEFEKAISEFNETIKENSNFPEAHLSLANTYLSFGQRGQTLEKAKELIEKAIDHYQIAIKQRNGIYPLAHENLGIALVENNQKQEAYSHFRLAMEQYGEYGFQTFQNLLTSLKPSNQGAIFLVHNERSRANNPGNLVFKKQDSSNTSSNIKNPNSNPDDEEQNKNILEAMLEEYANLDETLKEAADIRYCAAQAYLIVGNENAAIEEMAIAENLSKNKDKK